MNTCVGRKYCHSDNFGFNCLYIFIGHDTIFNHVIFMSNKHWWLVFNNTILMRKRLYVYTGIQSCFSQNHVAWPDTLPIYMDISDKHKLSNVLKTNVYSEFRIRELTLFLGTKCIYVHLRYILIQRLISNNTHWCMAIFLNSKHNVLSFKFTIRRFRFYTDNLFFHNTFCLVPKVVKNIKITFNQISEIEKIAFGTEISLSGFVHSSITSQPSNASSNDESLGWFSSELFDCSGYLFW